MPRSPAAVTSPPPSPSKRRLAAVVVVCALVVTALVGLGIRIAVPGVRVAVPGVGMGAAGAAGADARARAAPLAADTGRARPRWIWPTGVAVVLRPWEGPESDYGPGHRGVDVSGAVGAEARAVADGTVAFAGAVGSRGVVTIDHGGGLVSTLDSVAPTVHRGDLVRQGDVVGVVTEGHCTAVEPCLHLGARIDDRYVDPAPYLSAPEWPVLLPGP